MAEAMLVVWMVAEALVVVWLVAEVLVVVVVHQGLVGYGRSMP